MKRKVVATDDGSSTIYLPELDEHYHSSHGAIQEALHVFIENGLLHLNQSELTVFELGFGTGLNALLTLKSCSERRRNVHYIGLEAFPVAENDISQLNYIDKIDADFSSEFQLMHSSQWNEKISLNEYFSLIKIDQKIQDYQVTESEVDVVYFDAFGFRAQEEMWSLEILTKMFEMLRPGGILVTYAARGQFKRDLKTVGFNVESLPGPPGKREMTRAIKPL